LAVLERQLRGRELIADECSIADTACFPWAAGTRSIGIESADFSALTPWSERIEQRPAVLAAKAVVIQDGGRAKYLQVRAKLTPQEWATLFGE
jgi:glutathione S-transferase